MKSKSKKMTILYVLKMLQEGTNKFHPITQSLITKVINNLGIKCDRRTVARNIQYLKDFGIPIARFRGGTGYAYVHEKDNFFTLKNPQFFHCDNVQISD